MMNLFGKTMCPKGGWRLQCGDKCMYKHFDDDTDRTQQLTEAQITRITRLRSGQEKVNKLSPRKRAQRALDLTYGKGVAPIYDDNKADMSNLSPMKKAQRAVEMEIKKTATENGYYITGMRNTDGSSCYINSAVQSFNSLHTIAYSDLSKSFYKQIPTAVES